MNLALSERFSREFVGELKAAREAKGLSQYELAKRSGVSRTMIHHMENGLRNPTLITTFAITTALGMDFSKFANAAEKTLADQADSDEH